LKASEPTRHRQEFPVQCLGNLALIRPILSLVNHLPVSPESLTRKLCLPFLAEYPTDLKLRHSFTQG
jgi:hypothetical protein